jgi:hypothetical protein
MYFMEKGQHIALVVDKHEYLPFIRREIIHVLGAPSWNDHTVLRYSELDNAIRLVSKSSGKWEQDIKGMARDSVYYVEGWNVDDVRHSPYCGCAKPDEAHGYYVSAEGKLVEDNICDICGRRISDAPDAIKYAQMGTVTGRFTSTSTSYSITSETIKDWDKESLEELKEYSKPMTEFKHEYLGTWVEHTDAEGKEQ